METGDGGSAALDAGVLSVLSVLSGASGADPEGSAALDAYEERAAIREADGGQPKAEDAALAGTAQAAGVTPEALLRLWTDHPDAHAYLAFLLRHGPATAGAAAATFGWHATRAWQAEARLRAARLVSMDALGQAVPVVADPGATQL